MPTFTPPTFDDRSQIPTDPGEIAENPAGYDLRRYGHPFTRGENVYKLIDGTYTTTEPSPYIDASVCDPLDPTITVAITYLGGHSYEVTRTEALALIAAGYAVDVLDIDDLNATIDNLPGTINSLSSQIDLL